MKPMSVLGGRPVKSSTSGGICIKVIAYEQGAKPDGTALDAHWLENMLIVSANWGGEFGYSSTPTNPPGDNCYCHLAKTQYSLIKLDKIPQSETKANRSSHSPRCSSSTLSVAPPASNGRGWFYAKSSSNLTPSESVVSLFGHISYIPIPTQWIVVYGNAAELSPQGYILDNTDPDGSMLDEEKLRQQVYEELLGIRHFSLAVRR
jgi:hypothetical protein